MKKRMMFRIWTTTIGTLLVASCYTDDPVALNGLPELETDELAAAASRNSNGQMVGVLDEPFTARLALELDVGGGLHPDTEITVTLDGVAVEDITGGTVQVALPTLAGMEYAGQGKRPMYPSATKLPVVAQWDLPALSAGDAWKRQVVIGTVEKGYYNVVVNVSTHGPRSARGPYLLDQNTREAWLLVQPGGGFVTPMFDETVFPDRIAPRAGPFQAKAPYAADSTTTGGGGSAAHDGDDDVSLHLVYHDFNNQLTDASGVYVTAWTYELDDSDGFPVRTETASTPSNGIVSFTCPDADHYVSGNATLPANDVRDGAGFLVYWEATHDDCGETIQETGTGNTYLPWKHLAEVIPEINEHFGYSLNHRVHWIARTNASTNYSTLLDRIRFGYDYNHIWIAAHEYTHALHENKLGGIWSATNCTSARRGAGGVLGRYILQLCATGRHSQLRRQHRYRQLATRRAGGPPGSRPAPRVRGLRRRFVPRSDR